MNKVDSVKLCMYLKFNNIQNFFFLIISPYYNILQFFVCYMLIHNTTVNINKFITIPSIILHTIHAFIKLQCPFLFFWMCRSKLNDNIYIYTVCLIYYMHYFNIGSEKKKSHPGYYFIICTLSFIRKYIPCQLMFIFSFLYVFLHMIGYT